MTVTELHEPPLEEAPGVVVASEVRAAELAVIGECIARPHNTRLVASVITGSDFDDVRLGAVFDVILGMVGANGPDHVTAITVSTELERRRAEDQTTRHIRVRYPNFGELAGYVAATVPGRIESHGAVIRDAAVKRSLAALGRRTVQETTSGEDGALLAARLVEAAKGIRDGHRATRFHASPLGDVMNEQDDAYQWVVPGLIEARDRLVITGAEGLGKSTFLRQLAICAAAGIHPFNGKPTAPVRVLYVDCENSEKQWRRNAHAVTTAARHLGSADPGENVRLACVRRIDILQPADIGALHGLLDDHEPDILVIGPLYKLVPKAINNDDDAAPVLAALDSLRDRGPALLMEAHAGHAVGKGGERDYRPRGSAALLGWPEFGFGLVPDQNDRTRAEVVRWRGDRDERYWPGAIRRGGVLPWTDDAREPSPEEIRAAVTAHGRAR